MCDCTAIIARQCYSCSSAIQKISLTRTRNLVQPRDVKPCRSNIVRKISQDRLILAAQTEILAQCTEQTVDEKIDNYVQALSALWSNITNMQASITLDQPGNVSFTNLDQISGKVVVRCGKSTDVSSITVKLEGESRTRLLSPPGPTGEKAKPQLEYHKVCAIDWFAIESIRELMIWLDTLQSPDGFPKCRSLARKKLDCLEVSLHACSWQP